MANSRTPTGPRPYAPYGSGAYLILYYGRMVKRPFTTQDVKNVFRGKFPSKRTDDVSSVANRLAQKGFLAKLDKNTWKVTPEGLEHMAYALGYYREFQWRNLGVSYMQKIAERSANAQMKINLGEQLDIEEEILNEVESRLKARSKSKKESSIRAKQNSKQSKPEKRRQS